MSDRDEAAIIKILNLYAIAMDARRWDLFDKIFTDDVELEYPSSGWTDRATFQVDFAKAHERYDATQHALLTPLVEVDGDRADSFSYCMFKLIIRGAPGGDFVEGTAWYDDRWLRTDAGWRISRRRCRILWSYGSLARDGSPMAWDVLREQAAAGEVGFLNAFDRRGL
jgi:hypothetical protein